MPLIVGTSGWQYRDWRGVLYAPTCPMKRWLEAYATEFVTVENNNAFYRLPERATFEQWRDRTPADFCMAVKASRFLTHIKRLRDPEEPVARLMDRAAGLGSRLGPVLLQLPPTLKADPDLLAACLDRFPRRVRVAVEPRHASWWTHEVEALLRERNAALCWADRGSRPVTPLWRTADWGYVRFHEGAASPAPRYGAGALRSWLDRITDTWADTADVFVYFNNDPGGAAIHDARSFIRRGLRAGRTVPHPGINAAQTGRGAA
jgi:uncharacterized protein YecE (DUF72 family)